MTPMKRCHIKSNAFTLAEILVVITIILILGTLGISAYQKVRRRSQLSACTANLQAISQICHLYLNRNLSLPSDLKGLLETFTGYGIDPTILSCPMDAREGSQDSYSRSYVRRRQADPADSLLISCSRHQDGNRCALLDLSGAVSVLNAEKALFLNSSGETARISPGDSFVSGSFKHEAGVEFRVADSTLDRQVITPTSKPNKILYLAGYTGGFGAHFVIFIPPGILGSFSCSAGPSTSLELVTAQLVVELRNTAVAVTLERNLDQLVTTVTNEGDNDVTARHRDMDRRCLLIPGSRIRTSLSLSGAGLLIRE